ncbi:hypothetical protein N665_0077s0052 [Sinapis alba]|nr:hypothetical protein N665_0077s0052 [Sinapis alba]
MEPTWKNQDLRRVLDNRPYIFAYWMVILQRWELVISTFFSSLVPFWIRIKGLPPPPDTINGLKPLVKESIVEFDSGEEKIHCSFCYSLLHQKKNCPKKQKEDTIKNLQTGTQGEETYSKDLSKRSTKVSAQNSQRMTTNTYQLEKNKDPTASQNQHFQKRVDRHKNTFGERFDLFPQRSLGQWRPKHVLESKAISKKATNHRDPTPENTNQTTVQTRTNISLALTKEAVVEELHEVTTQYLSFPNSAESAKSRQRVLYGDVNGLTEETAEKIMASASEPPTTPLQIRVSHSNIVTPPLPTGVSSSCPIIRDPSVLIIQLLLGKKNIMAWRKSLVMLLLSQNILSHTEKERDLVSSSILRDSSAKKKKISQIQNSPGRSVGSSQRNNLRKHKKMTKARDASESSQTMMNPPIQMIPAMTRKK